jgi:hypothetical protein
MRFGCLSTTMMSEALVSPRNLLGEDCAGLRFIAHAKASFGMLRKQSTKLLNTLRRAADQSNVSHPGKSHQIEETVGIGPEAEQRAIWFRHDESVNVLCRFKGGKRTAVDDECRFLHVSTQAEQGSRGNIGYCGVPDWMPTTSCVSRTRVRRECISPRHRD